MSWAASSSRRMDRRSWPRSSRGLTPSGRRRCYITAASTNGPRHGYRRKRTGPECLSRIFPDEHDPITLAQLHAEAVAKFVAESGYPPLRHIRFEEYIRLQAMLTEEERRLHADHPYTLSDHLRWYLQIPRREYRG